MAEEGVESFDEEAGGGGDTGDLGGRFFLLGTPGEQAEATSGAADVVGSVREPGGLSSPRTPEAPHPYANLVYQGAAYQQQHGFMGYYPVGSNK